MAVKDLIKQYPIFNGMNVLNFRRKQNTPCPDYVPNPVYNPVPIPIWRVCVQLCKPLAKLVPPPPLCCLFRTPVEKARCSSTGYDFAP